MIKEFGKWVLEQNPSFGLTLFTTDPKTGEGPLEMDVEDVIDYLKELDNDFFPYLESYYEYVISSHNAPDIYYTALATLYAEKIFKIQPKGSIASASNQTIKDGVKEYRQKLQRFLETKKQYE